MERQSASVDPRERIERGRSCTHRFVACVFALVLITPATGFGQHGASPAQRMAEITRKAFAGDAAAQVMLGTLYCEGWHQPVNLKFAAWWFLKAAKQGNTEAEQRIAEAYEFGYGVRADHTKALDWIRKASSQDPDSANAIASDYAGGQRMSPSGGCSSSFEQVPKDPASAIEWYRVAVAAGSVNAERGLGVLYEREPAVRDLDEALRWYREAAQTDPLAMVALADMYATGTGVPQDYSEAVEWYGKASERTPWSRPSYELGLLYEQGLGVPRDLDRAMELYYRAATRGESDAQRRFFNLYEADLDLPTDPGKVIAWYEAAAEAGNARAQAGLGLHYWYGKGVRRNPDVACALYVLARRAPAGSADVPGFVVPDRDYCFSNEYMGLVTEMAKPGNLLKAIAQFLVRPRPAFELE